MTNLIVTHLRPDLDACSAIWLIKRFLPDWQNSELAFVPAGETYSGQPADSRAEIIHVDTGFGRFDHHQSSERSSSARKVFDYLLQKKLFKSYQIEALERLVDVVTFFDNFREVTIFEPDADYHDFSLHQVLSGLEFVLNDDSELVDFAEKALDATLQNFLHKTEAEREIKIGYQFEVGVFKCLALETRNEDSVHLAQKKGFHLVIRKDPKSLRARIKVRPDCPLDLQKICDELTSLKEKDRWMLHSSHKMLLNGSSRNQTYAPTRLNLSNLVELVRKHLL